MVFPGKLRYHQNTGATCSVYTGDSSARIRFKKLCPVPSQPTRTLALDRTKRPTREMTRNLLQALTCIVMLSSFALGATYSGSLAAPNTPGIATSVATWNGGPLTGAVT